MKISLIGAGNVATQLATALEKSGHHIIQVCSRTKKSASALQSRLQSKGVSVAATASAMDDSAEIYIVCVPDDATHEVISSLKLKGKIICHTSASAGLLSSRGNKTGIFYPLQTLSKDIETDFIKVPVIVCSPDERTLKSLSRLAFSISEEVHPHRSAQLLCIHVAAVIANNFTNHFLDLSSKILSRENIPPGILHALVSETVRKAMLFGPSQIQTGPAVRGDKKTIKKHIQYLEKIGMDAGLYKMVTKSIEANSKKSGNRK